VLQELLATERARISPGMLNSTGTACDEEPGTPEGITPMHLAASCGSADVIRLLIQAGADVNPLCDSCHIVCDRVQCAVYPLRACSIPKPTAIRNKVLLHGAMGSGVVCVCVWWCTCHARHRKGSLESVRPHCSPCSDGEQPANRRLINCLLEVQRVSAPAS
jgi:hypothetical protein